MAQVKNIDETEMLADSLDELYDNSIMHNGKIPGDIIQLAEYC